MYDFIISGQIPGTELEITFTMWAYLFALVLAVAALYKVRRDRLTMQYVMVPAGSHTGSALKPLQR